MTSTYEPRAVDVRALALSLGLGALIGLAVGGAYIVGGVARQAVSQPQLAKASGVQNPALALRQADMARPDPVRAQAEQFAPAPAAAKFGEPTSDPTTSASLRDRFSLALGLPRSGVQPFHFKAVDAQTDDHSRDTQCLAQAVYYEARGESSSGQAAVAQVVLNRVRHPAFPKTVCGVVFQHAGADCQFSFACNGAMRQPLDRASWRRAMAVADRALSGSVMSQVGAATHFQAARSESGWAGSLAKVAQIGEHIFYRFSGRSGAARMFQAHPQRSAPGPDAPLAADDQRVHAVFTAAAEPVSPDPKASANASRSAPTPVQPEAKSPTAAAPPAAAAAAGNGAQTIKAVEAEKSQTIATAATSS